MENRDFVKEQTENQTVEIKNGANGNCSEDWLSENERVWQAIQFEKDKKEYKKRRKFNRTPLILALLGLIFSVIYGVGIAFAIPALVLSIKRYKQTPTKTLKWGITISIVCIAVCLIYFIFLTYGVLVGIQEIINGQTTAVLA